MSATGVARSDEKNMSWTVPVYMMAASLGARGIRMDDETKLITSRLSRTITRDGITVEIHIVRSEGDPEWTLEVVDHDGACTVWEDTFATEQDALNEVFQTIAVDGMSSFLRQPEQKLH
jgi:hypothetical protein